MGKITEITHRLQGVLLDLNGMEEVAGNDKNIV